MGIFDRISTLFRSNINDLISRAENPEKMLNQLITDMKTQLGKAKQEAASAIADESGFRRMPSSSRSRRKTGNAGPCSRSRRAGTTWPLRR